MSFKNMLEVKNYINENTGNHFVDGEKGYYLTYFANMHEFLDAYDGRVDESFNDTENFIAITGQHEGMAIIPDDDFLIFDSCHFDEMTVIDTLDKYKIDRFIDDVKCYTK